MTKQTKPRFLLVQQAFNPVNIFLTIIFSRFTAWLPIAPYHVLVVLSCILLIKYFYYKTILFVVDEQHATYTANFIVEKHKSISYKNIKEVQLYRGPFQKMFGLGTVDITTHATTKDSGIIMCNLKDYQEVYDLLMQKSCS